MQYMILDSTGSAINSFDDEVAAHAAFRALVENEPEVQDEALLVRYDDGGVAIGRAQAFEDLPPCTASVVPTPWNFSPVTVATFNVVNRYIAARQAVVRPNNSATATT
jgi:hypothetical protein